MQNADFRPHDLFGQIQGLVSQLEKERQARHAVEAADASKSNMLSAMRQELRDPVESVAKMTSLLLAGHEAALSRRDVAALSQSTQQLLTALNRVTDFTDLETDEPDLAVERFDLHAIVQDAAAVLQRGGSAAGLTIGIDMAEDCPRFLMGDERRVRDIVLGLVEASLSRTTEGSVQLHVGVDDSQYPFTVRFDVTDTSDGLTAEELERLFEPAAEVRRFGGALGLPLAQRLAEAMGGGVGCSSAEEQGSVYWFSFKAVAANEAPRTATARKAARLSGHVLIVEGNTVNRMLLSAYLDEFGLTYEAVETGAAALMCLAARRYDLVLTDSVLPDYSGRRLAERIRTMQFPAANVAIVALTAPDAGDDFQDLVTAGANARVNKPVQGASLYAGLMPFLSCGGPGQRLPKAS